MQSPSADWRAQRRLGTRRAQTLRGGCIRLVLRLVGGLAEVLEPIRHLVVEMSVGGISGLDVVVGTREGKLESRWINELLNPRHEGARLLELDGVAITVEQSLEELLLGADKAGNPRLDALFADEVEDIDRLVLTQAVDPPDALLEDGRVPGQLEVDDAIRSALEVRPTPPASLAKSMRNVGSSWNSTMFCVRRRCRSAPVKNPARRPCPPNRSSTAQCDRWSIRRH
jgi:hypothetical protein